MRPNHSMRAFASALCCLFGCTAGERVGSDCPEEGPCQSSSAVTDEQGEVPGGPSRGGAIDKVDILFVVDDSGSMKEEQNLLAAQLPRLLESLRTGDADGAGSPEFRGVSDVHVGFVSTDLGIAGVEGIDKCEGRGDDGVLKVASPDCLDGDARFVDTAAFADASAASEAMQCMVTLGTDGCGFEAQLEAGLKALWPSTDDRVTFLPDPQGVGALGQGDQANAGFLRDDSLLIVMMVTDEEDCSPAGNAFLRPPQYLDPSRAEDQVLMTQGLNVRCESNVDSLYGVERYINGLKELRPYDDLVMFFAIAGMPPEAVDEASVAAHSFEDRDEREAFYEELLADPMMQPAIDDLGTPSPDDDTMVPVCDTEIGRAYPARRVIEVARGFGVNGMVQSICEPDFGGPMSTLIRSIGRRLGPSEI